MKAASDVGKLGQTVLQLVQRHLVVTLLAQQVDETSASGRFGILENPSDELSLDEAARHPPAGPA
ncbi:MAG: hypothetical protein KatS3mg082_0810 [Nitrospiraceae bacterium]|nr:MAG: hypothetical protein KatS3mg082_0810 [Nitrospiraceae bacterium]